MKPILNFLSWCLLTDLASKYAKFIQGTGFHIHMFLFLVWGVFFGYLPTKDMIGQGGRYEDHGFMSGFSLKAVSFKRLIEDRIKALICD